MKEGIEHQAISYVGEMDGERELRSGAVALINY